jgi:hypothetical protein
MGGSEEEEFAVLVVAAVVVEAVDETGRAQDRKLTSSLVRV